MDLARAVYSSLEPLQRFGVRAEWQDTIGPRSYTSAFDIAATVVSPLGFGFTIPDSKFTRLPVFDTEYLKNKFHIKGSVEPINIDAKRDPDGKIRVWVTFDLGTINVTLPDLKGNVDGGEVFNDAGVKIGTYNGTTVTIDGNTYPCVVGEKTLRLDVTSLYEEMYGQFNASIWLVILTSIIVMPQGSTSSSATLITCCSLYCSGATVRMLVSWVV